MRTSSIRRTFFAPLRFRRPQSARVAGDCRGFTLPEVLIVVGIVGIFAGIAVPYYSGYVERASLDSSLDQLTRGVASARNRAIGTYPGSDVVICPSGNPNDAAPSCSATASVNYSTGWLVFVDCNNNELFDTTANLCDTDGNGVGDAAELLIQQQPRGGDVSIQTTNNNRVVFSRVPMASNSVTFNVSKDGTNYAQIAMNATGRMQITPNENYFD